MYFLCLPNFISHRIELRQEFIQNQSARAFHTPGDTLMPETREVFASLGRIHNGMHRGVRARIDPNNLASCVQNRRCVFNGVYLKFAKT